MNDLEAELVAVRLTLPGPPRGQDPHGNGAFAASRGARPHRGLDCVVDAGEVIGAPTTGRIIRIGYPYGEEKDSARYYRLIEILSHNRLAIVRVFYVEPSIELGTWVAEGDPIGTAQDLQRLYPGITNHVHCEVFVDPSALTIRT